MNKAIVSTYHNVVIDPRYEDDDLFSPHVGDDDLGCSFWAHQINQA